MKNELVADCRELTNTLVIAIHQAIAAHKTAFADTCKKVAEAHPEADGGAQGVMFRILTTAVVQELWSFLRASLAADTTSELLASYLADTVTGAARSLGRIEEDGGLVPVETVHH